MFNPFAAKQNASIHDALDAGVAAAPSGRRYVRCCFCHHPFCVSLAAIVLTCPACNQRARVDDIIIANTESQVKIETCGKVFIRRRGKLSVRQIRAGLGIEVLGALAADNVRCGRLYLGPGASWQGDCTTGSLNMDDSATVRSGKFTIDPHLRTGSVIKLPALPLSPMLV